MYYSTLLLYYTASALIDQGYTCRGRVLVFQVRLKHFSLLSLAWHPFGALIYSTKPFCHLRGFSSKPCDLLFYPCPCLYRYDRDLKLKRCAFPALSSFGNFRADLPFKASSSLYSPLYYKSGVFYPYLVANNFAA